MLPLTSGEIIAMNPGEQDQNPFRRPGSFAGAQNNATQPNTSKYFGARSRFNRNRGTTQTANVQQPTFTSYAQEPSYPTQQPKYVDPAAKKRKKIIAIIGLSLVAIIILIAVGATIISNTGILNIGKNHNLSDLQALLEKSYPYINEAIYNNDYCADGGPDLWSPDTNKEEFTKQKNNIAAIDKNLTEFVAEIDKYGGIKAIDDNGETVDLDSRLEILKENAKKLQEFFVKFHNIFDLILDIYISEGSEDSINALKNASSDEDYIQLANNFELYYANEKALKASLEDGECKDQACIELSSKKIQYQNNINDGSFDEILKKIYVELNEEQYNTIYLIQEIHRMKPVEEKWNRIRK